MMKQDELTININNLTVSTLQLSEDTGYVLYSAFGSFYIPSCIMVFVYINIYFAARSVNEAVFKNWWKVTNECYVFLNIIQKKTQQKKNPKEY